MVLPISARAIGRTDGDPARAHVRLGLADDLVGLLFLGVLVDELHRGAELDPVPGELRDVDHLGAGDHALELERSGPR